MENYRLPGGAETSRQAGVARLVGAVMERCREFFSSKNIKGREEGNEGPEKALGEAAIEACACHLYEIATHEGLLGADEERPVITIEGEKFNVPEELVDWLHSKSRRARNLAKRVEAWNRLTDIFWQQESRINELLKMCDEHQQDCSDEACHKRLEARRHQLDKLWGYATRQYWHARKLSKYPEDAPYASYVFRA